MHKQSAAETLWMLCCAPLNLMDTTLPPESCVQPVVFKVDYAVEQLGNREFGSVFLGTTNVAEAMVAAGMAKVRMYYVWMNYMHHRN
jgi:hypothetical protein